MGGSRSGKDRAAHAAACVAAEPAFEALDASGAPIVAATGDPLVVIYMNASARAVFGDDPEALAKRFFGGDDPGARRLSHLINSVRQGGALRLERLRLQLGDGPQTVTVLCRRLDDGDDALFAVAALGVRPAADFDLPKKARRAPRVRALAAATPVAQASTTAPIEAPALTPAAKSAETKGSSTTPAPTNPPAPPVTRSATESRSAKETECPTGTPLPAAPKEPSIERPGPTAAGPVAALRQNLVETYGSVARFVWNTDADGRFTLATPTLAAIVGDAYADIVGLLVSDVAGALSLEREFVDAIASQESWSGINVDWPLAQGGARAPITLSAEATFAEDGLFEGFAGQGLIHLDRVYSDQDVPNAAPSTPAASPPSFAESADLEAAAEQERKEAEARAPTMGETADRPPPEHEEPPALDDSFDDNPFDETPAEPPILESFEGDNIVRLRPPTSRFPENETPRRRDDVGYSPQLTPTELSAFEEIARTLHEGAPPKNGREKASPTNRIRDRKKKEPETHEAIEDENAAILARTDAVLNGRDVDVDLDNGRSFDARDETEIVRDETGLSATAPDEEREKNEQDFAALDSIHERDDAPVDNGADAPESDVEPDDLSEIDDLVATPPVETDRARYPLRPGEGLSSSAFALVLDRLPVGVVVARGEETLFANRALLDYLGYADQASFDADGGLARMFFGQRANDVMNEGGARPVEVQGVDGESLEADAHLQIVDWEGAPATLVTLRRSRAAPPERGPEQMALTFARTLEEKLAAARADNARLESLFNASSEPAALIAADGQIQKANTAFAARAGVDARALEGASLSSFLTADDARALAQRLARVDHQTVENKQEGETMLRLAPRGGVAFHARLRRLDDSTLALTALPQRSDNSDKLESARLAAENASAAKSDFLARVSHEIRTPLNAIIGFAEVMLEERLGPIGSPRYKEYLRDVHASGSHVLSIVNDLLDLSKIEAGKLELAFERVDANAVISECASIMQAQANRARIVVRLSLAQRLPLIRADLRSLKQILLNLMSNAVKFNEPGGQVIVSSTLTEAGYVIIRVKDNGIGMSADEVHTALEPFKQIASPRLSARQPRGTGLGLPLTKALIEANQASFTIKSRKNEGTLIEIAFPPPQVLAAE